MSYNKLKSLVANVEAIETAMKIQVQGRQATAEEKEILSRYSGFGGIKEVLNIGTDKPISGDMQEPIQRLQELINAYPHFTEPMRHNVIEGIKASVLTAFYTPKFLVDAVVRQIQEGLIDKGTTALSLYGIANSFEQLSQKPIVIGEKYIQINRQGTLVRNPNRVYTTKGEVAKGVGRKIYFAGLIIDTALWISGKQTFSEAALNMGVNTGIYIIGAYCPPVGIALGILWFITSVSKRPYISPPSYEEIHGTITPADATRVDRPYYCEPMKVRPNHKKHILRQGK